MFESYFINNKFCQCPRYLNEFIPLKDVVISGCSSIQIIYNSCVSKYCYLQINKKYMATILF